ncbi:flagellar motor switch protein FliG [Motilibacter aurantiacus]|uniref:flagellar motor switch protein FliG n=1 Tax=Motilibacter aurantiacus TaxID=2714955 RepID=UPI0014097A9D|nr:flagellar motor switch protein FliG [Motilibacter aurantiacus]NHC47095.1 flagellar motor switch protein FliG [Motilibacter aurantiacus]
MTVATLELSGLTKTAVLLVGMGREHAAKVLAEMRESEVEEITAEIMRLRDVDAETALQVFTEFHGIAQAKTYMGQGGMDFAKELLAASMGEEKAAELMHRLSAAFAEMPFQFLHRADPRQLLSFLQDEHPQTIALVLAHMSADQASTVLGGLVPTLQADVAHRIAVMDRTSPEVVKQVEQMLERKLSSVLQPTEMSVVGGLQPLVDIINRADRSTERLILEGLEGRDRELAEEVRSRMFMFEDIVSLDDKAVQLVLRQVETSDLATALKGVRDEVRMKIMKNLSERAAENLADEIEMLGPVRLKQVEESQVKVVQAIRQLEESGQITVRRGADDEFVD